MDTPQQSRLDESLRGKKGYGDHGANARSATMILWDAMKEPMVQVPDKKDGRKMDMQFGPGIKRLD
jgi:hypothetical protein